MKTVNYNADPNNQAKRISVKDAIELLNKGSKLTKQGKDLDTISKKGKEYHYKGLEDQGPTILTEEEVKGLIKEHNWVVDLF